uniref:Small ribosomal subunit protein uS9c n=1 Tax=Chloroparvula japonica TaxID=1411623 RepID=A0A4D6C452_9CHLO|nr:ribosomal protein S9 [Chloroparvula japonica]QBX98157.1 ribosomal protein S9 [Chloroparvula japonica]
MRYDNVFTEIGVEIGSISHENLDIDTKKIKKQGWLEIQNVSSIPEGTNLAFTTANGRHKRSAARALVYRGNRFNQEIVVNGLPLQTYFQNNPLLLQEIESFKGFVPATPVEARNRDTENSSLGAPKGFISAKVWVNGGGLAGQAKAVRLAIAKAVTQMGYTEKTNLRKGDFVTTDARRKERKKYGLKKARKAPQFSKR